MALRILQFSAVFAVGYSVSPNPDPTFGRASDTISKNLTLSLKLSDPKDVAVQRGQSATLSCDAESNTGVVQYFWFHNEESISLNDTRWIVQSNGSLYIPKVAVGRKTNGVLGEYRCLVKDKAGALLSNAARLKVASIEQEFKKNPTNQTVPLGQTIILQCSIHSTPPADIQWEFNNLPLPHNTRYVPLPGGFLFIENSQDFDSGSYRCKATNDILNKTKYSKSAVLKVSGQPAEETLPTVLPLDISPNTTANVGEILKLYCPVMGWPTPTVQWINSYGRVLSNSSLFQINSVKLHDMGDYTCLAYNSLGHVRQNFRIDVLEKPFFNITPISKSFPPSGTVRMECRAGGTPEPKIVWLKDGKPVEFDTRIKKQSNGIIFRHTFTRDSGIYQCVAINPAGKVWSAAHILINVSLQIPSPPQNVQCRPYDSSSICLSWRPPQNITLQAYTIHSVYKTPDGLELSGPENVTNMTFQHIEGLNSSTNYTFYVRSYSKAASDSSEKVTCKPGIVGKRDLQIELLKHNSIVLKWNEISSDRACDGKRSIYRVQWKEEGHESSYIERSSLTKLVLTNLTSGTYEFRITSNFNQEPWIFFTIPDADSNSSITELSDTNVTVPIYSPIKLEGFAVSGTSVLLEWSYMGKPMKFFTVCYVPVNEKKSCENGKLLKSSSTKLQIDQLEPNTTYEFKVRSHNSEGNPGSFSKSIEVKTPEEVPSPVLELKYKRINDSTICLHWREPEHKNGKIQKYFISYSPDEDRLLEQWLNITIPYYQQRVASCWIEDTEWLSERASFSVLLGNLTSDTQYVVIVRAVSEVGIGRPTYPLIVNTKVILPAPTTDENYHQKMGIIFGTIIALICIILCIICILMRRRCIKRRALARARTAASNNYYPAVAQYASHVGTVQVRLENSCAAHLPESEHLVQEGPTTHIPPVTLNHCDTKGGEDYPNGHINGTAKPYMNGHLPHNHVHIIENPQVSKKYYAFECNGQTGSKQPKTSFKPVQFEEDSNSNVKSSKFYDLYRLFENSKKSHSKYQQCNHEPYLDEKAKHTHTSNEEILSEDEGLNMTHLTCVDDSLNISMVNNNSRLSPVIGPNG